MSQLYTIIYTPPSIINHQAILACLSVFSLPNYVAICVYKYPGRTKVIKGPDKEPHKLIKKEKSSVIETKPRLNKHKLNTSHTLCFLPNLSRARGLSSKLLYTPAKLSFFYLISSILLLNRLFFSSP